MKSKSSNQATSIDDIFKHNKNSQNSYEIVSKKDTTSRNSQQTLRPDNDYSNDSIPFRISFIRDLIGNATVKPVFDLDNTDTDNFIGSSKYKFSHDSDDEDESNNSLNKKFLNFSNAIRQIGGKLMYIKSGASGHTFKGINRDINSSYGVKVVAYTKNDDYGSINNPKRPENAELMMIKLLSYFVIKKQTPHITLPIATFNTNITNFVNLSKTDHVTDSDTKYHDFVKDYKNGKFHDEVSILISEWANRGDFSEYVKANYKTFLPMHWKVFFFQIISTLAVIQTKFPSFRHNDLKANNILLQKVDRTKNTHAIYNINGSIYKVPNIGYQIKIWDFDFACIPGLVDNAKVSSSWTTKINVIPKQNRYYDMHYFFNTLIRKGFFPQFMTENCVPDEAREFVNRIVPKKFQEGKPYVHERGRILIKDEYLIPDDVLKHDPYFSGFRVKQRSNSLNSVITQQRQQPHKQILVKQPINKKTEKTLKQHNSQYNVASLDDLLLDSDS